jgi:transcriptional regulator with XRE-family HTH domain
LSGSDDVSGERLRELRTELGLSVRDVASGIGKSHTTIVRLEGDKPGASRSTALLVYRFLTDWAPEESKGDEPARILLHSVDVACGVEGKRGRLDLWASVECPRPVDRFEILQFGRDLRPREYDLVVEPAEGSKFVAMGAFDGGVIYRVDLDAPVRASSLHLRSRFTASRSILLAFRGAVEVTGEITIQFSAVSRLGLRDLPANPRGVHDKEPPPLNRTHFYLPRADIPSAEGTSGRFVITNCEPGDVFGVRW